MVYRFFTFLLLLFTTASKAQTIPHVLGDKELEQWIYEGTNLSYNFQFAEAKPVFEKVKAKYPTHPLYDFLKGSSLYWEMLYEDSYKERSTEFFNYMSACLQKVQKMYVANKNDIEAKFFELSAESYLSLYYAERHETNSVLKHAKAAYAIIKEAFTLKEKMVDFYFPVGLYNYFVVQYPETHPAYKPFMVFFVKGDKKLGLQQIDHATHHGIFTSVEAKYHIVNIYLKYEGAPLLAYPYASALSKKYPENLFYCARYIECLLGKGEYKEAETLSYKLFKSGKKFFVATSYVFYGELYEKHYKDLEKAKKYYAQAILAFAALQNPEKDYLSFAYAGLGRCYHQAGQKDKAKEAYRKAKELSNYTSVRKEAKTYLEKN